MIHIIRMSGAPISLFIFCLMHFRIVEMGGEGLTGHDTLACSET